MTKKEFQKVFALVKLLVCTDFKDATRWHPSAHLISHCGGYELWLSPTCLVWGQEIAMLSLLAERECLSIHCEFHEGLIVLR